jgi:hypothetical protein
VLQVQQHKNMHWSWMEYQEICRPWKGSEMKLRL